MTSHRRVKGYTYDADQFGDFDQDEYDEGEEEISSEDKENLRQGTARVWEALGSGFPTNDSEIQEALWHYFYDVGKSVTYIKNKYETPKAQGQSQSAAQTKKKTATRFDQAASSAATASPKKSNGPSFGYPIHLELPSNHEPLTAKEFFKDTPWLAVPAHRLGSIMVEPLYPRLGLLGGSTKPSKLAALAAARKRKQDSGGSETSNATSEDAIQSTAKAVAMLDSLQIHSKVDGRSSALRTGQTRSTTSQRILQSRQRPVSKNEEKSPELPVAKVEPPNETPQVKAQFRIEDLKASPSPFARAMLASPEVQYHDATDLQDGSQKFLQPIFCTLVAKPDAFAGPSPDDVVVNAQSKGKASAKAADGKKNGSKATSTLHEEMASVSVNEAPSRAKSKNLNVVEEFKNSNIKAFSSFVVIGHVDHGKSTLMGRLLSDLKVVDQKSVDKLRREAGKIGKGSFALAWVMDQTPEERERGVTVDIATNTFETEKTHFTILDAPGHRDFIPNMIAGTSQADFAVLVIDAGTNSFESGLKGQTKEHALLARSIGVPRLIVAVNKMDLVEWSQERFLEISQQMSAFLTSAGFQQQSVAFIPCAGLSGANIVQPPPEETMPWYHGRTLIEELDAFDPTERSLEKPLRLTVSDVFRTAYSSLPSVSGRIDSGFLQVGDQLIAMPSGEHAYIKAVEMDNEPIEWAVAGQLVSLQLTDVDISHLRIGDILCSPQNPIGTTTSFTAKALTFEHVMPMFVDVLRGRIQVSGRITKLISTLSKSGGEVIKKKPRVVQPGSVVRIVVEMDGKIPVEAGDKVVLRADGQTVAACLLESTS